MGDHPGSNLPLGGTRIKEYASPAAKFVPHPHNHDVNLKARWIGGLVDNVRDRLKDSFDNRVQIASPDCFLAQVHILLEDVPRLLESLSRPSSQQRSVHQPRR